MKTCKACDVLIHQISYKQNHIRNRIGLGPNVPHASIALQNYNLSSSYRPSNSNPSPLVMDQMTRNEDQLINP